jgi:hypothetical protein
MSLPPQWREWATPLTRYGVKYIGHMGQSDATLLRRKRLSGQEDGQAGEVKAPVRSSEPPHHEGSESPPGNAGDGNVNPSAVGAVGSRPPEPGHRHLVFPHSSSASRFTAGASGFFILSQSGERPKR